MEVLLRKLALRGAMDGYVYVRSRELAVDMGVSQQTAARWLKWAEEEGYIRRVITRKGQRVALTEKGVREVLAVAEEYNVILSRLGVITIVGRVEGGLGEGRYYMSVPVYREAVARVLGGEPYPGTLNVRVDPGYVSSVELLRRQRGEVVRPFEWDGRTFGAVSIFRADINGEQCAVLFPERTHHTGVVEIAARKKLRDALGLRDGDTVEIRVRIR